MSVLTVAALKALWVNGFIPDQDDYVDLFDTIEALGLVDSIVAANGLTRNGNTIKLGGAITEETQIPIGAFKFLFGDIDNDPEAGDFVVAGIEISEDKESITLLNANGAALQLGALGGITLTSPDTNNSITIPSSNNSYQGVRLNGAKIELAVRDGIINLVGTNGTQRIDLDLSLLDGTIKALQFPNKGGVIATLDDIPAGGLPYQLYAALVSQTGTSAPVRTVLYNDLGNVPSFTRTAVGTYSVQLPVTPFPAAKTTISIQNSGDFPPTSGNPYVFNTRIEGSVLYITTYKDSGAGLVLADGALQNTNVEIKVYP